MSSDKLEYVPEAPYPPMAEGAASSRNRSLSFTSSKSNSFSSKIKPKPINININSPPPSRGDNPKRHLSAAVEFYTGDLYGAVNCREHVAGFSKSDSISSGSGSGSTNVTPQHANSSSVIPPIMSPNMMSQINNVHMPVSALKNSNRNLNYNSMGGIKKLGPVLLDMRCLRSYASSSSNHAFANKQLRAKTFALSRGISSLGTSVASTCLSFRKYYDIHGNTVQDVDHTNMDTIQAATGLTTGALCIHTLRNIRNYIPPLTMIEGEEEEDDAKYWQGLLLDSATSEDASVSYYSHYQPRHHRQASSVAWRPGASNSRFVAIGLLGSSGVDRVAPRSGGGGGIGGGAGNDYQGSFVSGKDRDYCALVWDVEVSSNSSKGMKQAPVLRLAHNSGVASLAWMKNGDILAVGCTQRNIQIYDLRIQGTSAPPISTNAHDNAVHGIKVDPTSDLFATFSRGSVGEPVKLWDMRRMDSCVSEIKLDSKRYSGAELASSDLPSVADIGWDTSARGVLSIATNESLKFYDTRINPSRPTLIRMTNSRSSIQSLAFHPQPLRVQRMLAVSVDGYVSDLPLHEVAPVSISSRDGRISSASGGVVWAGSPVEGPAAMERYTFDLSEDISATMMRRARCLHIARYSTDASSNLKMIQLELESLRSQIKTTDDLDLNLIISSREELWRLWSWIERVEHLCSRSESDKVIDERRLSARGLQDAGMVKLLKMDVPGSDELTTFETSSISPLFNREVYNSPMRRAALTACGWVGKFGMQDALAKLEARGKYERSAALAVWNSDIGEAVAALQRGADHVRSQKKSKDVAVLASNTRYAETLELVAMCIAGYNGSNNPNSQAGAVWKRACESLLKRSDMRLDESARFKNRGAYLRAVCAFLIRASGKGDLKDTLDDECLSLSDRCAFASIFLSRHDLRAFLEEKIIACISAGNLEGIIITGLERKGISLLQSFVDKFSDVQTAALVSSRVILPPQWSREKMVSSEWLETYREMLNKWQMWQSRALFDVGRVEQLRKLRQQAEEAAHSAPATVRPLRRQNVISQGRRQQFGSRQNELESALQTFPPQIQARCNYCNTSLPLAKLVKRQDGIANNWLSRQNPVLSCCPNSQCRKPLPRCAICLLPLGCLNPYLELRKHGLQNVDDLSDLSNLPFAEWFTWCMRCKHGGHAHHMVGWFSNHSTCPVSNCDCQCQFDGIQKLRRTGLPKETKGLQLIN